MHEFDIACLCEHCHLRWREMKNRAAYHSSLDSACMCRSCVLVRSSWLRAYIGVQGILHDLMDDCLCATCREVDKIKAMYA